MYYYDDDGDDIYRDIYRDREQLPENDEEYTLSEFARRLLKSPDGAYEHICECCLRFERIELYEIVKALALGISYNTAENGETVFRLAGNYLLDSIKTGLPHDETDNSVSSECVEDNSTFDERAGNDYSEDTFVQFKIMFEKTVQANKEAEKQYEKLINYISELEASYIPLKVGDDEGVSLKDMVLNCLLLNDVSKADVCKGFRKRFSNSAGSMYNHNDLSK